MVPPRAGKIPMMARISVVLPAPLRPIKPHTVPAGTSSSAPRMMAVAADRDIERVEREDHVAVPRAGMGSPVMARCTCGSASTVVGRPSRDDGAVDEGQHAARIARDDVHVVLDEHDRDALVAQRAHDEVHDGEFLLDADAAGGLVEQQEPRLAHQRHGDVEQLAHALGQKLRRLVAIFADAEALDQRVGFGQELSAGATAATAETAPPAAMPQAMRRLSKTVALANTCGTWNEREMPAAMMSRGGSAVMSRPSNAIVPLVGWR